MLTGLPPSVHGVFWKTSLSLKRRRVETPTVFSLLRSRGYATAAFFSKAKFSSLQQAGSLDYWQAPGRWFGYWPASGTEQDIEKYLRAEQPDFLFVHLADPDHAGHHSGWMSAQYGEAIRVVDRAIAGVIISAEQAFGAGNFTLIVTADHGGHDRHHGTSAPEDMTIPWIAWGQGVRPGRLTDHVNTVDTASTILWLFGVPEPNNIAGHPVFAAFANPAPPAPRAQMKAK